MYIIAYLASIFIGISLGLIGGGGSILTVPVLVYLFHVDAVLATAYSLFIVGTTSVAGSMAYFKKGLADLKVALVFGLPSIAAVFFTRTFVVPAIPQQVFSIGHFTLTKSTLLMLLFALLMVFASYSMIRKSRKPDEAFKQPVFNYPVTILQGVFVGAITGLVGAGGGFLIIPALVNLLKLPMKTAVGTSLVIIAINSLAGFLFSLHHLSVDWVLLLSIAGVAIAGIFIGSTLAGRINGAKLKPAFGWFVLLMGIYMIIKETAFKV